MVLGLKGSQSAYILACYARLRRHSSNMFVLTFMFYLEHLAYCM